MLRIFTIKLIKFILWIIDKDHRIVESISDTNDKKFTHTKKVDFQSDFAKAKNVFRTVPYNVWQIKTEDTELLAADKHLIKTPIGLKWIQDLSVGDLVCTKFGDKPITTVKDLGIKTHMYDLEIDSEDHLYYSNDILSHNTATASGYLLWYGMFVPDATILIAAHKYAGAQEIMQRIRYGYESVPNHIRAGVTSYNKGSIEFDSGSRILSQATTETTGRGLALTLLYLDEFAFVRPNIAKEFWTSISPTLSTGGKAMITSTPNSDEDQFALIWKEANKCIDEYGNPTDLGINGFKPFKAVWYEHPDRDEQWAKEERGRISDERFRREHLCEFIIFDETLISPTTLVDMVGTIPIERQGQVRWYGRPKKDRMYLVALDPSLGTGGDNAAIQVFELPDMVQIAEWQHNKTPIQQQIQILSKITEYLVDMIGNINDVYYSIENNSIGEAALVTIAEIGEENISGCFLTETKRGGNGRAFRRGFNTTNRTKLAACAKTKSLVETKRLKVNSSNLISEFKNYIAVRNTYEAKVGETDDLVSATLLAVRMAQTLQNYNPTLDAALRDKIDADIQPMPFIIC